MDHVFLSEIAYQSLFAKRAARLLKPQASGFKSIEIWGAIQFLLAAAGNISKILWPSRRTSTERGRRLRALLNVDRTSILAERKLRNHFEHYDERIEDWFSATGSAVYVDQVIDPLPRSELGHPQFSHRKYDPLTQKLTFRGESLDLGLLIKAVDEVYEKCPPTAQMGNLDQS